MRIDKEDFDKLLPKVDIPLTKIKITDINKYMYWHRKEDELLDKMKEYQAIPKEHIKYMHEALLCELEKHKYDRISTKEFVLLLVMLKFHNARHEDKLYMDKRGRRVKKNDRRAVR